MPTNRLVHCLSHRDLEARGRHAVAEGGWVHIWTASSLNDASIALHCELFVG